MNFSTIIMMLSSIGTAYCSTGVLNVMSASLLYAWLLSRLFLR